MTTAGYWGVPLGVLAPPPATVLAPQRLGKPTYTSVTGATSITAALPQTPTAGNLLIVTVLIQGFSQNTSCSLPAGWTAGPKQTSSSGTVRLGLYTFWKLAAGGDAAPVFTTNTTNGGAVSEEWAGLNSTAPHAADGTGAQTTLATATTLTDAITTSTANEWVWSVLGTVNQLNGLAGVAWTLPQLSFTAVSASRIASATAAHASGVYPTAGAVSPSVAFTAASSRYTGLVSMSFKTAAGSRPQVAESVLSDYTSATTSWAATLATAPDPADVLICALWHNDTIGTTSVSGCGATWTQLEAHDTAAGYDMHVWVGRGAASAGAVTVTSGTARAGQIRVLRVSGQASTAAASSYARPNGTAVTGPVVSAGPGQVVVALMSAGGSGTSEVPLSSATPALGTWSVDSLEVGSVSSGTSQNGWTAPSAPATSASVSGTAASARNWPTAMVVCG